MMKRRPADYVYPAILAGYLAGPPDDPLRRSRHFVARTVARTVVVEEKIPPRDILS